MSLIARSSFTIPKTLRTFFRFRRKLLGELCRCAARKEKEMPELPLEASLKISQEPLEMMKIKEIMESDQVI